MNIPKHPSVVDEQISESHDRVKWTTKQWYEHVGAWETAEGHISFGSVMALGAMLIQFQRAHQLAKEASHVQA